MRVILCKKCGFQLHRKAKKCLWCKSPVKKKSPFRFSIFVIAAGTVLLWVRSQDAVMISSQTMATQPQIITAVNNDDQIKDLGKFLSKVYVRKNIANLRREPSMNSPALRILTKGQRLIEVNRSGNWVQVVSDGGGDKRGWVHASLIGDVKQHAPQKFFVTEEYKTFLHSYERLNKIIKRLKGMTFFGEVVYLGNGVIQVTATDALLSAPKSYRKEYFDKISHMWLKLNRGSLPVTVRIVDPTGRMQYKKVMKG